MEKTRISLRYGKNDEEHLNILLKNSHKALRYHIKVDYKNNKIIFYYYISVLGGIGDLQRLMRLEDYNITLFKEINRIFFPNLFGHEEESPIKLRQIYRKDIKCCHEFSYSEIPSELKEIFSLLFEAVTSKKQKREEIEEKVKKIIDNIFSKLSSIDDIYRKIKIRRRIEEINLEIFSLENERKELEEKLLKEA